MATLRVISRATLVVVILNGLFLLLLVVVHDDATKIRHRVRAAFASGDLGFNDYLLFDSRRGFFQYNDCNVLQMIANSNPSRMARAISPIVYAANDDWTDQCAVLHRVTAEDPDVWDAAYVLTYGSARAGRALVLGIELACLLAAAAAWRDRRLDGNIDRVIVLAASLIPVAWVLVLPQHTVIHATFMVRILVGSIALAPLAVFWPVAGRR